MHDNNMAEAIDISINKVTTEFKSSMNLSHMNINGVLVTDRNGLILANEDVKNDCSGSIAMLSVLASTLFDGPVIVCLENGDQKIIIREAGKTVFSVYTEATRR